jgi:peptide deformylase
MNVEIDNSLLYKKIKELDFNAIKFTYLNDIIIDMTNFVINKNALGLAANQISLDLRLFVMIDYENRIPYHFINPMIISRTPKKQINKEGCLSFPTLLLDVMRNNKVDVQYFNIKGEKQIKDFTGILSVCVQHEFDHLNGITFVKRAIKKLR